MNYISEKTSAEQMATNMRSLMNDIAKNGKAIDRKRLRDQSDQSIAILLKLKTIKNSYTNKTHTDTISDTERQKRINSLDKLILEI